MECSCENKYQTMTDNQFCSWLLVQAKDRVKVSRQVPDEKFNSIRIGFLVVDMNNNVCVQ